MYQVLLHSACSPTFALSPQWPCTDHTAEGERERRTRWVRGEGLEEEEGAKGEVFCWVTLICRLARSLARLVCCLAWMCVNGHLPPLQSPRKGLEDKCVLRMGEGGEEPSETAQSPLSRLLPSHAPRLDLPRPLSFRTPGLLDILLRGGGTLRMVEVCSCAFLVLGLLSLVPTRPLVLPSFLWVCLLHCLLP